MYMSVETVARSRNLSGAYADPLALLTDYRAKAVRDLTEEERDVLRCCCDFESIVFYVDEKTKTVLTVDDITDDIIGTDSMDDFLSYSVRWAREEL